MPLKIGLIGANGKMGQRIAACILKDPKYSLAWQIGSKTSRSSLSSVDIIIDFSNTNALEENLSLAEKTKTPIVIGTTGFEEKEKKRLEQSSLSIPIFWAPNFSLGMAALIYVIKNFSPLLQKQFIPHITETHHKHKKDAPSGSALALAEAFESSPEIKSIRQGDSIGHHQIVFSAENEKIIFEHESLSRDIFALGALNAANFLIDKSPKLYSMEDLLLQPSF